MESVLVKLTETPSHLTLFPNGKKNMTSKLSESCCDLLCHPDVVSIEKKPTWKSIFQKCQSVFTCVVKVHATV